MGGTITWIPCEERMPKNEYGQPCSNDILLWAEGKKPTAGNYWEKADQFSHSGGNWRPTHWAYINYPTH